MWGGGREGGLRTLERRTTTKRKQRCQLASCYTETIDLALFKFCVCTQTFESCLLLKGIYYFWLYCKFCVTGSWLRVGNTGRKQTKQKKGEEESSRRLSFPLSPRAPSLPPLRPPPVPAAASSPDSLYRGRAYAISPLLYARLSGPEIASRRVLICGAQMLLLMSRFEGRRGSNNFFVLQYFYHYLCN